MAIWEKSVNKSELEKIQLLQNVLRISRKKVLCDGTGHMKWICCYRRNMNYVNHVAYDTMCEIYSFE